MLTVAPEISHGSFTFLFNFVTSPRFLELLTTSIFILLSRFQAGYYLILELEEVQDLLEKQRLALVQVLWW